MGRVSWENTLARPGAGDYTVIMGMEDGPATPDNQLCMHVGKPDSKKGCDGRDGDRSSR